MALASYADLQTQIANWLARDDLNSYIPDFITLFEAAAARRLRVNAMEVDAVATPTNGEVCLPTDYLAMRRLTLLATPYTELQYVTPQVWADGFDTSSALSSGGLPQSYTIEAGTIKLRPAGDNTSNVELVYYAKTPALSSALNWLYANHPDAYLFGSLAEANAFNKNVDPAGLWKARRDEVFEEIKQQEFKSRPVGMMVRLNGVTP